MTDLEKMQQWLQTYPNWQDHLQMDIMAPVSGSAGLFSQGLEELSRQQDILGNLQIACRYRFTLYRHTTGSVDGTAEALWLLDFQNWVQRQSALGLTPCFGDIPHLERMQARRGELKNRGQMGVYAVTLLAEFTRVYQQN